jgi:hypothetical protein
MSTRIHQLHYFAFALLLKASGLCHGQMTELNDERAMLAQSLSQGGRLAVFADHAGSPARVRELIREPRMQQGGEQHWERSDRSPLLRDPPLVSALQRAWKRGVVVGGGVVENHKTKQIHKQQKQKTHPGHPRLLPRWH